MAESTWLLEQPRHRPICIRYELKLPHGQHPPVLPLNISFGITTLNVQHSNMKGVTVERDIQDLTKVNTLGSVRLHHVDTKEIILIPTPSEDPRDPLTWLVLPGALQLQQY